MQKISAFQRCRGMGKVSSREELSRLESHSKLTHWSRLEVL